jgi:hypothetical protein
MSDTDVGTRFVGSLSMIAKPSHAEADTGVEKLPTSESGVYSDPRKSPAAERGALDG